MAYLPEWDRPDFPARDFSDADRRTYYKAHDVANSCRFHLRSGVQLPDDVRAAYEALANVVSHARKDVAGLCGPSGADSDALGGVCPRRGGGVMTAYTLRRDGPNTWTVFRYGQPIGTLDLHASGYHDWTFLAGQEPSATVLRRLADDAREEAVGS